MKEGKTEITIETYEVLVISVRGSLSRRWCASCSKQVALISLDEACMAGFSREAVQRQVEAGRIHLIESVGKSSLICLNLLIPV